MTLETHEKARAEAELTRLSILYKNAQSRDLKRELYDLICFYKARIEDRGSGR